MSFRSNGSCAAQHNQLMAKTGMIRILGDISDTRTSLEQLSLVFSRTSTHIAGQLPRPALLQNGTYTSGTGQSNPPNSYFNRGTMYFGQLTYSSLNEGRNEVVLLPEHSYAVQRKLIFTPVWSRQDGIQPGTFPSEARIAKTGQPEVSRPFIVNPFSTHSS